MTGMVFLGLAASVTLAVSLMVGYLALRFFIEIVEDPYPAEAADPVAQGCTETGVALAEPAVTEVWRRPGAFYIPGPPVDLETARVRARFTALAARELHGFEQLLTLFPEPPEVRR